MSKAIQFVSFGNCANDLKVNTGLHGAIVMNPWNNMTYAADGSISEDKLYNISQYEQHILMFQRIHAVDSDLCEDDYDVNYVRNASSKQQGSIQDDLTRCDVWRSMHVRINNDTQLMYYLVNGQYQPRILNFRIGEYQQLRMINSEV